MKHRYGMFITLAALTAALALSGCSNGGSSSAAASAQSAGTPVSPAGESSEAEISAAESATAPESSASPAAPSDPESDAPPAPDDTLYFLVGLDGKPISRSSIGKIFTNDGDEPSPDGLTEDNFSAVLCTGFTYVDKATTPSYNSIDNADIFDVGTMTFEGADFTPQKDYVRLNVGDSFGGLVLESAETNFSVDNARMDLEAADGTLKKGSELGIPEIYYNYSSAQFSGSFTLSGYACCVAQDDYGIMAGDVLFVPDNDDILPKMCLGLDGVNGINYRSRVFSLGGFTWANEYGYIRLGNIYEDIDDPGLPDDGSFAKVTVTAENYSVSCGVYRGTTASARLTDISF